jgi:selenocysteine lyase/cysteine desulfurase
LAYDVDALRREEFPWSGGATYLNHASTGPLPASALRGLATYGARRAEPHRLAPDDLFPVLAAARAAAARLLNADPAEVALAPNTSFGLNLAALALPLEPGSIILASDREFPALVYPFRHRARRGDVAFELLPVTPEGWPDEAALLARLADPRVRCVAVSLTQFANGYTVDLARLSRETRARGTWLVVDAIQACGQVPVDVRATPVDILSCGAQKWLLSPWGTGFTWVRPDLVPLIEPPWAGWMAYEGTDDFSRLCDYDPRFRGDARRYEMVTLPFHDFVAMTAAVELLTALGPAEVASHLRAIRAPVVEWAARRDVPVTSPLDGRGSGIICVAPPAPERAFAALEAAGISTSLREGSIRISPHAYNTLDEMERVAAVLDRAG